MSAPVAVNKSQVISYRMTMFPNCQEALLIHIAFVLTAKAFVSYDV